MKTWVALLRAVNLAGRNAVAMADLRALLGELGFRDVRSLLQSGNLVFGAEEGTGDQLESLLREATRERLGLDTGFFVRDPKEWQEAIDRNPFLREAETDPGHLLVTFLAEAPPEARVSALRSAIRGREAVASGGPGRRHLYIHYPDGVGRSRLTSTVIERHLGTSGTARNWNTVLKVGAALGLDRTP